MYQDGSVQRRTSVLGIIGLIVGIIALITSFIPIVNNASFVLAIIGGILALIGVIQTARGTRSGKALAIIALVINILAIVLVLVTQSIYSKAIQSAASGPAAVVASGQDTSNLAVGETATFEDGLAVTVNSVQTGLTNYDGSAMIEVNVTYTNNGTDQASFNMFDWKGQNAQGAQQSSIYYSQDADLLNSGTLVAGGTITGNLYLEGDSVKAVYSPSMISNSNSVAWAIV